MSNTLIINRDQMLSGLIKKIMNKHNIEAIESFTLPAGLDILKKNKFDVIIYDSPFSENKDIFNILRQIKEVSSGALILFIVEKININQTVELVKEGVYNFITKPIFPDELISLVKRAIQEKNNINGALPPSSFPSRDQAETSTKISDTWVQGVSKEAKKLYKQIHLVANTPFSVIIYGETGTGKESVASLLSKGDKSRSTFIAIDCGCLSKDLAASELFGHEKGAFTGAAQMKKGAFELADKGTLFLDEIGNLNYEVQTYLLRAIQEKKIRRIGGSKEIKVDVRIIVASNENLLEAVNAGRFREDLYHRLNEFEINIPPLRERKEDLQLFIDFFLSEVNIELNKNVLPPDEKAFKCLYDYHWPGNIRELKNVVRRACLLTQDGRNIEKKHLPLEICKNIYHLDELKEITADLMTESTDLKDTSRKAEVIRIIEVLKEVNYNKTKAAMRLNIDRKTLYNKLKHLMGVRNK